MSACFELRQSLTGGFFFHLKSDDELIILTSKVYDTRMDVDRAVYELKKAADKAEIKDLTPQGD